MTKYAKMLCTLAIGATALATFSLSSDEAFARSGVVRRVATRVAHPVSQARANPFVRGRLNQYAAKNLRNSRNVSSNKHAAHDSNKGPHGYKESKEFGDKDKGHRGDKDGKEYGDKHHRGDKDGKEYGDNRHRGDKDGKDYGDNRHRGDKDKNGGKDRSMGGQQAGGQQGGGGGGFPDLSSLASGAGGSAPAPASSSSPADAGSASPATASSNCTSHHTWRNGQRVLIQVCPDA